MRCLCNYEFQYLYMCTCMRYIYEYVFNYLHICTYVDIDVYALYMDTCVSGAERCTKWRNVDLHVWMYKFECCFNTYLSK